MGEMSVCSVQWSEDCSSKVAKNERHEWMDPKTRFDKVSSKGVVDLNIILVFLSQLGAEPNMTSFLKGQQCFIHGFLCCIQIQAKRCIAAL